MNVQNSCTIMHFSSFLDNNGGNNGGGWGWGCHVPYDQSHAKPIIYRCMDHVKF